MIPERWRQPRQPSDLIPHRRQERLCTALPAEVPSASISGFLAMSCRDLATSAGLAFLLQRMCPPPELCYMCRATTSGPSWKCFQHSAGLFGRQARKPEAGQPSLLCAALLDVCSPLSLVTASRCRNTWVVPSGCWHAGSKHAELKLGCPARYCLSLCLGTGPHCGGLQGAGPFRQRARRPGCGAQHHGQAARR